MSTRLVHLIVDAQDPASLARFWAAALGWEPVVTSPDSDPEEVVDVWPPGYSYPDPAAVPLVFVPVPGSKTGKNPVHLDLASTSPSHQAQLVARLRDLGARPAQIGQGDVPWVVLADPEGNELCVLEPRDEYLDTGPVAAIVIDCADPAALAAFWTEAAGWPVARAEPGITGLRSPAGTGPYLELLRVPGPRQGKNRLHPDIAPFPGGSIAAEAARLRAIGATPADIGQAADLPWTVLADPEANEFCVLTPR
jgi:hypothetical protein